MSSVSLLRGDWRSVVRVIGAVVDLEATSRTTGALRRVRKVRSAEGLLRLALMYGPGGQSLRAAAARAGDAGIAELSDKAVEGRLRGMGDWLSHILGCLLASRAGVPSPSDEAGLTLSLVDGSVICAPGRGGRWKLHACYDPGRGRFTSLQLTTDRIAEETAHTPVGAGRTVITDRGYARVRNFHDVLSQGSDFITRMGWRAVRLHDASGQKLDVMTTLPNDDLPCDRDVHVKGIAQPLRLVIQRLPAEGAGTARRKKARKASRNGHKLDPRTAEAAGFLILLTSLSRDKHPAEQIIALYRHRWQVEIGFKRLKTLGGIDRLPAANPALARTWLLAHLIAAVMTDDLASEIVGVSPSA
ncbi:IS4 family transposase [Gluconacetobacter johannae]|uniref:IS4 family transposase n=1 Tax=Gluconacetobacter johannae TaxID=112140 RepID=UPI001FEBDD58|nr:IS4 family transposase [Gluconacetobacter johannae]